MIYPRGLRGWHIYQNIILAGLLLAAFAPAVSAQELSKLPYVPTPQVVVDEMLKLAGVTADDFVIDLGSGDGRIVITAAKRFKAKGLGVDIDGKLVALSNRNARAEQVEDRVEFAERDMFKTEISKASVLTLYVLPDFMQKLRSKVLAELKPGTRVVAHDYPIDEWHPDRFVTLTVPEKMEANGTDKAYLYLWIVPAGVGGTWRVDFDAEERSEELVVTFSQRYQMIDAVAERMRRPLPIQNPALTGAMVKFSITLGTRQYQFSGRVDGDKIEGTATRSGGKGLLKWRGTRVAKGS
ncbi:MAG: class I SAM-dependent methyltransferase [Deltaproteobacteria bacterium]|nr:class I SAM-dependent methyltransferase [Deltaproteobacteria bacterium]